MGTLRSALEQAAEARAPLSRRAAFRQLSVMAASMGTGVLALACARRAERRESTPAAAAPASLTFLGRESGSEVPVYEQSIARFQELQPRVK
ncbi:MAG: hypothetical protein C4289_15745, partial [Chloroflexota bacterium]